MIPSEQCKPIGLKYDVKNYRASNTFDKLEVGRVSSKNPAMSGLTAAVTDSSCLYSTTYYSNPVLMINISVLYIPSKLAGVQDLLGYYQ